MNQTNRIFSLFARTPTEVIGKNANDLNYRKKNVFTKKKRSYNISCTFIIFQEKKLYKNYLCGKINFLRLCKFIEKKKFAGTVKEF